MPSIFKTGVAVLVALMANTFAATAYECNPLKQKRVPNWVTVYGQNSLRADYVYGYARNQISEDISLVDLEADLKERALRDLSSNIEVTIRSESETRQNYKDDRGGSRFKSTDAVNSAIIARNLDSTDHFIDEQNCVAFTRVAILRNSYQTIGRLERDPLRERNSDIDATLAFSYDGGSISYNVGEFIEEHCGYVNRETVDFFGRPDFERRYECQDPQSLIYSVDDATFSRLGLHMFFESVPSARLSIFITEAEHPHGYSELDYEKFEIEFSGILDGNTALRIGFFEDTNIEAGLYFGGSKYRWFNDYLGAFIGFTAYLGDDKHYGSDDFFEDEDEASGFGTEISAGLKLVVTQNIAFELGHNINSFEDYDVEKSYLSLDFQF